MVVVYRLIPPPAAGAYGRRAVSVRAPFAPRWRRWLWGVASGVMLAHAVHGATALAPHPDAPKTRLAPQAVNASELRSAPGTTQLQPRTLDGGLHRAPGGASTLRPSGATPTELERTEQLLQEFKAVESEAEGIVFDLPSDVLFDFDKADLRADAQPVLARARELIAGYEGVIVIVHGHTDSMGSDAYNLDLSRRRAEAVAAALQDAAPGEIRVVAHGERQPVAANQHPDGSDHPEGRQRNRRVQVELAPAGPS